ncbi:MAG: HAMP domain-containing histidine kinase [Coriobacteriia bacterium]|nr:HAMP domain-containing histidine kinase [Coriobacteriia bacterium]
MSDTGSASMEDPGLSLGHSLRTRFVALVLLGELLFALVVGLTVGVYSARTAATERRQSLERVSLATSAALAPMIADQDIARVQALMDSIMASDATGEIECIQVLDGTDALIACSAPGGGGRCETYFGNDTPFGVLTRPQTVRAPVIVEGFEIATVSMNFGPPDLLQVLGSHAIAAFIVVLSVALVSAPWTAWLVLRTVIEPIARLRDGAHMLAEGEEGVTLDTGRRDEIGELARTFEETVRQLADKERRLEISLASLEEAYEDQSKARDALEEVARMKSDFVAVASHELRTPLSVIRLYAEMLEEGELGGLSEESHEAISSIASAASRLSSIVSDLMDAALLERGLMPLEFSRVELDKTVRASVRDANTLAAARGVRVVLDDDVPEIDAWIDPLRIRQLLDNLIFNAVKYSDGAPEVQVRLRDEGDHAGIDVIDSGRGVREDQRNELFKLFAKLDSEDSRDTAGLGLGLAISARIAEAHGGSIGYAGNPLGKGSIFTLKLPIGDASVSRQDASISVVSERGNGDQ